MKKRQPAVAGTFYPGQADQLRKAVNDYLNSAQRDKKSKPKAVISPHAGYIYSGPIAGSAYIQLINTNKDFRRVILLGPAHWVGVSGLAASDADQFSTPLGDIPLDKDALASLLAFSQVHIVNEAHRKEHALEVQLPFLQTIYSEFSIVPLLVGKAGPEEVAEILDHLWDDPETIVVISSDLSHYHDYDTAVALDRETSQAIEALQYLGEGQACGRMAINGLLHLAKERDLIAHTLDLRNSGDTAGPRDRVVGYGAYMFH